MGHRDALFRNTCSRSSDTECPLDDHLWPSEDRILFCPSKSTSMQCLLYSSFTGCSFWITIRLHLPHQHLNSVSKSCMRLHKNCLPGCLTARFFGWAAYFSKVKLCINLPAYVYNGIIVPTEVRVTTEPSKNKNIYILKPACQIVLKAPLRPVRTQGNLFYHNVTAPLRPVRTQGNLFFKELLNDRRSPKRADPQNELTAPPTIPKMSTHRGPPCVFFSLGTRK
jgi:hypothetical protein